MIVNNTIFSDIIQFGSNQMQVNRSSQTKYHTGKDEVSYLPLHEVFSPIVQRQSFKLYRRRYSEQTQCLYLILSPLQLFPPLQPVQGVHSSQVLRSTAKMLTLTKK